jgi:hypothetical protein
MIINHPAMLTLLDGDLDLFSSYIQEHQPPKDTQVIQRFLQRCTSFWLG